MEFRYCPRCATELEMRPSGGPDPDRPTCPNCGFVHYENPTPTVQAWIERDGRYLALRRNEEPKKGEWNMPGGFVEAGETGPEAAAREVLEETGLEVDVVEHLGAFPSTYGSGEDAQPIIGLAYRCLVTGGAEEISDESEEGSWFTLADFPEPAFRDERVALALLRDRRPG
ncbi:MAG: NUDIX hydrolase [Solirubrobacterales bacterium]|nr:NUDIX hydrolase [Solirubrobacterales bacterium]